MRTRRNRPAQPPPTAAVPRRLAESVPKVYSLFSMTKVDPKLLERFTNAIAVASRRYTFLAESRRCDLLNEWRQVFSADLFRKTGQWTYRGFDWHVFSYGFTRARNGQQALEECSRELIAGIELLVCPTNSQLPPASMLANALPSLEVLTLDVLVWPTDLSWTVAFTHEASLGLGPYFARRDWVSSLRPKH